MVTVYGVTKGAYSDYRVCYLFREQAQAQAVVDRLNGLTPESDYWDYSVEEFALLDDPGEVRSVVVYHATFDRYSGLREWSTVEDVTGEGAHYAEEFVSAYRHYETDPVSGHAHSTRGAAVALKALHDAMAAKKAELAGIA